MSATPLRDLGERTDNGYLLVRDPGSTYLDGGEERVYQIIAAAGDVSSTSNELLGEAEGWNQIYHLSPFRANVVRSLDLPPDAVVLDVGAGCGAVSRYLGEQCATVDVLEPVPARARAARERTRDLPGVEVFVAGVEDVPAVPAYDLITVIGVLEYVDAGGKDAGAYIRFLAALRALLLPGGVLAVAIENKLGVKYLCGAPEDHSGRVFDGPEGYPVGSPARTFSRSELADLFRSAGLEPRFRIAFPDYKMTRAVFDPEQLPATARSLLYRVPSFPSPDWVVQRAAVGDESLVWRSFVEAGLALETGNSFLVLATSGQAGRVELLWPQSRAGRYFSNGRRAEFSAVTTVDVDGGTVRLDREPVSAGLDRTRGMISIRMANSVYLPGIDMVDAFADLDDPASVALLHAWADLVRAVPPDQALPLDLVPRNVVVTADGPQAIDQEWFSSAGDTQTLLQRGCLLLALELASAPYGLRGQWAGSHSVRDMVRRLGRMLDQTWPDPWIDEALEREADFQATVALVPGITDPRELADSVRRELLDVLGTDPLRRASGGPAAGAPVGLSALRAEADTLRHELHMARSAAHELRLAAETATAHGEQAGAERDALTAALRAARADAAALSARASTDRLDLAVARDAAEQTTAEMRRMHDTLSWRITAPLRVLRRLGRRSG